MLELLLNNKSEDVAEIVMSKKNQEVMDNDENCENFAYRKNLLFYRIECKYCQYAKMIKKDGTPTGDYVCVYATASNTNRTAM